ncbi:MAG: hypothetical protein Q8M26_09805 [Pseudolabrys sp.]|nr:hypothetical protein [Pseudolabrys sp.]
MQSRKLSAESIVFYSERDEQMFFAWLRSIGCVGDVKGVGPTLNITLARSPNDSELRELIALFFRYEVDMRQLAAFASEVNRHWFHDTKAFWFQRVFC